MKPTKPQTNEGVSSSIRQRGQFLDSLDKRDEHITAIACEGRLKWQAATGYGKRALIETAIGRYKGLIGSHLRARSFTAQQTEVAIGCIVLNRMLACGRPESVRHQVRPA